MSEPRTVRAWASVVTLAAIHVSICAGVAVLRRFTRSMRSVRASNVAFRSSCAVGLGGHVRSECSSRRYPRKIDLIVPVARIGRDACAIGKTDDGIARLARELIDCRFVHGSNLCIANYETIVAAAHRQTARADITGRLLRDRRKRGCGRINIARCAPRSCSANLAIERACGG